MTITFDGTASTAFNALCFRVQTDNASVRQYDTTVVLGKNGNALFDRKRFPNETNVYYVVFRGEDAESDYSAFKNYVLSREGYKRLEDSEHPYEFYMAYVSEPIDPTVTRERDMIKCVVTFSRLPQRFLKSGEIPLTITASESTHTVTNDVVVIDNSAGDKGITNLSAAISPVQDLNGYDHPWPAGGGKNGLLPLASNYSSTLNGITATYNSETESFSLSGTNTKTDSGWILLNSSTYTLRPLSSETTYYFAHNLPSGVYGQITYNKTGGGVDVLAYLNGNGSFNKVSFTLPANFDSVAKVQIGVKTSVTTVSASGIHFGVYAENPTEWSPYSNICPISGLTGLSVYRTGKNLLPDKKYQRGTTYVYLGQDDNQSNYHIHLKQGTYALSCNNTVSGALYYKGSTMESGTRFAYASTNNHGTFTIDTEDDYQFYIYRQNGITPSDVTEFQLEVGNQATAYSPYNGTTYAVDWSTQAGTVYHGTVDPVAGQLTVDWIYKEFDGTEEWFVGSNYIGLNNAVDYASKDNNDTTQISNIFVGAGAYYANYNSFRVQTNKAVVVGNKKEDGTVGRWADAAAFKSFLADLYSAGTPFAVCYELATPLTYQLTPQEVEALIGTNNIWADAGDVTVTYVEATTFENPTYFSANPIIRLYGVGTLTLNGNQITITNADVYTDIDFETGECYKGDIDKNQYVSLSTPDFVPLKAGINVVSMRGITKIDVTPRWWQK